MFDLPIAAETRITVSSTNNPRRRAARSYSLLAQYHFISFRYISFQTTFPFTPLHSNVT